MPTDQILKILIGISSFGGVVGLLAYLYFGQDFRRAEESVRGIVEGDALFNAKQVVEILAQFKEDDKRLQALVALTSYSNEKARELLRKAKANVDVDRLSVTWASHYQTRAKLAAVFFLSLAVLAFAYYLFEPPKAGKGGTSVQQGTAPQPKAPGDAPPVVSADKSSSPADRNLAKAAASPQTGAALAGVIDRPEVKLGMSLNDFRVQPWASSVQWRELKHGYIGSEHFPTGSIDYKFTKGTLVAVVYSAPRNDFDPARDSLEAFQKMCGTAEWLRVKANLESLYGSLEIVNHEALVSVAGAESPDLREKIASRYGNRAEVRKCLDTRGCRFLQRTGEEFSYYVGSYSHDLGGGDLLKVFRSFVAFDIQPSAQAGKRPFFDCVLTVQAFKPRAAGTSDSKGP